MPDARQGSGGGVSTWHYRFSYVAQSIGKAGAEHASDIPYFFDTTAVKYADKARFDVVPFGGQQSCPDPRGQAR